MRDDWLVRVNGEVVKPVLADRYRIAVKLGEGRQVIELTHRPADFFIGLWITFLAVLLAVLLALREWFSRVSSGGKVPDE
jgi:uncharacterized membrane protein YfhO